MATALYQQIGRRIRRARESLNMSQEDLARRLDYHSSATISNFEAGQRKISIADLQQIAEIVGLPLAHFLDEQSDRQTADSFLLRAKEVRPAGRKAVTEFLGFAEKHGSNDPSFPVRLSALRPGKAAELVLREAAIVGPPVSSRAVAAHFGVPVYDWEFPDEISGIVVAEAGSVCIGVNIAHPHVRQRFTIAHELGHLVFNGDRDIVVDFAQPDGAAWPDDERRQALERKANQFAADLLMPRLWVQRDVHAQGPNVPLLARRYEVSEQALWFRLLVLKLAGYSSDG